MFCKNCKNQFDNANDFYVYCGTPADMSHPPKSRKKPKVKIKPLFIITIVLIITAITFSVIYIYDNLDNKPTPEFVAKQLCLNSYAGDGADIVNSAPDFAIRTWANACGCSINDIGEISYYVQNKINATNKYEDKGIYPVDAKLILEYNDLGFIEKYLKSRYEITQTELDKIDMAYNVKVTFEYYTNIDGKLYATGEQGKEYVYCIRYNGNWYAI